jgi:raffinose/stachyose/melibiose transport system permease protein
MSAAQEAVDAERSVAAATSVAVQTSARRSKGRGGTPLAPRRINLLYVPALALFAVFTVYPFLNGIVLSLTDWNGYGAERNFVGVANYVRLVTDEIFHTALGNTFVYGIGSTVLQQIAGLALALALDRAVRGRNLARTIIYLPVLVSPVVMGAMYYLLFSFNYGALNDVVLALGGERVAWLSDGRVAVAIIVALNSVQFVGISMVIYLAGLQTIPTDYYEAATLDGAGAWRRFLSISVPLLQPAFAASVVLNLIGGLKLFDVIEVLTGGGPGYSTASVSTLISTTYFDNQSAGYASAIGIVLFLVIAAFTLVVNVLLNRRRLEAP